MSVATASSPETIFVRMRGEGVELWRPVPAIPLGGNVFRLCDARMPPDEDWEFGPGDIVETGMREGPDGSVRIARGVPEARARHAR